MFGWQRRFRTRVALLARLIWRHRIVAFGFGLAVYGAASVGRQVPIWVSILASTGGGVISVGEIIAARKRSKGTKFHQRTVENLARLNTLVTPETTDRRPLVVENRSSGFLFREQSRHLRTTALKFSVDQEEFSPRRRELVRWGPTYLDEMSHERTVFNGHVLGLASDILPSKTDTVVLQRCGYFDFQRCLR
jgi:hypothetical protein